VGLLLLGGGATDECHSLVLPLSWDEDMHIGWGPARTSQAKMEASYAHALVLLKDVKKNDRNGGEGTVDNAKLT